MDLAHELSELREYLEWPPTPDLQPVLEPPGARRNRRRVIALGLAFAALVAVVAAFAVPSSRGAILRFFHLGAATIVRVDRLPAAEERPLSSGIGPVVTLPEARRRFPGTLLLPPLDPLPQAHLSGPAISFLFSYRGQPVLLTEFAIGPGLLKKFAGSGTSVEGAEVDGSPALFISGDVHDFFLPNTSPRLAGNVLLWEGGKVTYRLESSSLTKEQAVSLARSLTRS